MKYRNHQHLKLKDLSLHPKQCLHVISMLTNGQSYTNIQKYIQRTLKTDILKSTISNLKHKVITARSLKIPLPYLLDERHKPLKSTSKKSNDNDRITLLNCINSMIKAYYADIQSQTLTDKQRKAFIQLIKIKLHYGNQLKDEVLDTNVLTTVLEVDQKWSNVVFGILAEVTSKDKDLQAKIQHYLNGISDDINTYYNQEPLKVMKKYCKRHHILWTDDVFDSEVKTPRFDL